MRKFYLLLATLLFLALNANSIIAQGQKFVFDDWSKYQTPMERFNSLADYHTENLIFKLLQFNAPYGGVYRETALVNNGNSYSVRITPRARQASRHATLNKSQIEEIRRKLSEFSSKGYTKVLEPQDGQLYSAFVFNDGKNYLRFSFVGEIPNELQEIINFLNVEYEKSENLENEEFLKQGKILQEKYGNWLEKPEIIRPSGVGFRALKNNRATLLFLKGTRQPVKNNRLAEIPLYYALVFYPEARVVGGASGKGGRGDNPISSNGIKWALPEKTNEDAEIEKEFLITYDSINGTIAVGEKTYKLIKGNLLVIKMNEDWKPEVTQLKAYFDKPVDEQTIIDRFKKEIGDETLELS